MTDNFLKNLIKQSKDSIPGKVFTQAKNCFIDFLACTLAGAKAFYEKDLAYIDSLEFGNGASSVIGLPPKCSLQTAALINGMNSHVMELDDGHRKGAVHVGGTIFSALLPVAEKEKISMQDFLYGAIIGYETTIRLACAVQPGNKLRGYHATGTCGTVGATMAIAAALHFDFEQMKSAFSAAVTSAAGVLEMQEDNADLKPLNVGRAAMDAVSAAYLGKARFKAPNDALGGKRGFLAVMTDEAKISFLKDFENDSFSIMSIYNKPYASCRHTHPAIEAAMKIRQQPGFLLDEVESVCVHTYKLAVAGHDHKLVDGVNSAKMSMPYSVAVALFTGNAGLNEFSKANVADQRILDIAQKIDVVADDEFTALCPQRRAALVDVKTKTGLFSARIDYPKGEPENPLTPEEFRQKIEGLMSFAGYSKDVCEKLIDIVYRPEFTIDEVINLL
ncbi:MmgE/PrpD family protein [Fibrobacter succinogenes subsp. succinogenes S85]|nr:MmgE/PrpD family protein [Fibrobacter succinogenes]ACX76248.1 MmgE/PrpD family protein [Fibrobacter succinogenes subsp. succinogenes S85]